MIRTRACEVLGIEHPLVQGPLGPWPAAELIAAVGRAGALGSIAAAERPPDGVEAEVQALRDLYDGPFAVNHILTRFDDAAFEATLRLRPPVISFALGDAGDLVARAHDAGAVVMHQVHTVEQARRAAASGVDVIIAQGAEAGGNAGRVTTFVLVPQVVDAVAPVPVLAAGGVADGRGLAAALALGAAGVNVGTRFLASREAAIGDGWKSAIVGASSEDIMPVEFWYDVFPRDARGYSDVAPRSVRTPFLEQWLQHRADVAANAERVRTELLTAARERRFHEYVPMAGQAAGLIDGILPAGEIVRRIVTEAADILGRLRASAGLHA